MKNFAVSKAVLMVFLFEGLMAAFAFGDVIWRGTGTVTSESGQIQANEGDTVSWLIEYEESELSDDFDGQALRMSIQFVISPTQILRLDSPDRKVSAVGQRLVNWSLSETDNLSYVDFPSGSVNTVMTMRLTGDDLLDGITYADLRNPSFDSLNSFFGFVDAGSEGSLWFDVDISSIEIYERFHDGPLEISIPEQGSVDLAWSASGDTRYRVEASSDLKTFFDVYEGFQMSTGGTFAERNLISLIRFYRLLRLNKIFPL